MAADAIYEAIEPTIDDVVDALVAHGMPRDEAWRVANENPDLWNGQVDDAARADWVNSTAEGWVTADQEAQQARNQAEAGHARDPNSTEARGDLLQLAKAQGYYTGQDTSGVTWADKEREAAREYQRRRGLNVTGNVDQETVTDLAEVGAYLASQEAQAGGGSGGSGQGPEERRSGGGARITNDTPGTAGAATGTQGGGGEGGTGAGAGTTAPTGAPNPDGKFGIPGGAKIWAGPDGFWYVVYTVPGSTTPLAWRIESNDDVAAIFGPGNEWKVDRTFNAEEWGKAGILIFGSSRMLGNLSEHPFDAFVANFTVEARVRPWLRDPEVLALTGRAILEGREITEAELAGTEWWRNHTAGERQWMLDSNMDPKTAEQRVTDGRDAVRRQMIASGIEAPPDKLVNLIADRITGGTWTQAYAYGQIQLIADPAAPGEMDPVTRVWVADVTQAGTTLNTLADNTAKVDDLILEWLGPAHGANITDKQRKDWAGRLRNDPQAEEEIIRELRRKRLALMPEYTDERLSYEDIASTWRGEFTRLWGQIPDETDAFFQEILRIGGAAPGTDGSTGGLGAVRTRLRTEGLRRGVSTVSDSLLGDIADSDLGVGVRRVM